MNRTLSSFPVAATAATAAVAAFAAVGLVFLMPEGGWREIAAAIVPIVALVITSVLISVGKDLHQRGTEHGQAIAQLDPVTSLPSRPVAERTLAAEFAAAERGRRLVVVMTRFDNFSRFAATEGAEAAHRLLAQAGRILTKRTRGMNLSYRFDNQGTFLSILSDEDPGGAHVFAKRVQKDLTALQVAGESQRVSFGIAAFEPGMEDVAELIGAARRRLMYGEEPGATLDLQYS